MSNSAGHSVLAAEEVLAVARLIHRCCEMGHNDAYLWRSHLLSGLSEMIDAQAACAYLMKLPLDPANINPTLLLGILQKTDESWASYVNIGDLSRDPTTPEIMRRMGTDYTATRQELVSDEVWNASAFRQEVIAATGWDQQMISQIGLFPPGVMHGIGFWRAVGKPPFGSREVAIVDLAHMELARLWRRPDAIGIHELPARQREVLDGIRRGESRKGIADKMGVSEHTVHTYEKALFDRAGVAGRGELLARLATVIRPNLLP